MMAAAFLSMPQYYAQEGRRGILGPVLDLAEPPRLLATWRAAEQEAVERDPETRRRRAIDRELARRGIFARMQTATALAQTPAFRDAVNARRAEREAARDEGDLARLLTDVLVGLGADMSDLHVRLRRATRKETAKAHLPRQAAQIRFRIRPTRDAAVEAIAEVDARQAEGAEAGVVSLEQSGQGTPSG